MTSHKTPGLAVKSFGERLAGTIHINWKPGQRKWLKRQSSKKARAIARRDPEFAPRRMTYRGWAD